MLILASRSPRRAELLRAAGFEFRVEPVDVVEKLRDGETPEDAVRRLAEQKAVAVKGSAGDVVLGADTIVVAGGHILGKPVDSADAGRMLRLLSGRRHEVLTGICLQIGGRIVTDWATTRVWFTELSEEEIAAYIASGEPADKAGAYAIQGIASRYIERIDGSYSNVVGLPVELVARCLRSLGITA